MQVTFEKPSYIFRANKNIYFERKGKEIFLVPDAFPLVLLTEEVCDQRRASRYVALGGRGSVDFRIGFHYFFD